MIFKLRGILIIVRQQFRIRSRNRGNWNRRETVRTADLVGASKNRSLPPPCFQATKYFWGLQLRCERQVDVKEPLTGAVVVAQLVERSLPTSEIRGSNPDNGKIFYIRISTNCNKIEKTKIKGKRPGMAHLFNL